MSRAVSHHWLSAGVAQLYVMRKKKIIALSAFAVGTALSLAVYSWLHRFPLRLQVVGAEPSGGFYFGEKQGVTVTFSVKNQCNGSVHYGIPTFQAQIEGHWMEFQQTEVQSNLIMGSEECRAKLVMPEGTKCRLRIRYGLGTWRSRFALSIGAAGRRFISKSQWVRVHLLPDKFEDAIVPTQWNTNTVEVIIPTGGHL